MPITYIGKKSKYVGKPLIHYLANLKNFGVGRMFVRSSFERYPELTYYIIHKVEPEMDEEMIFGRVWAQRVFRGIPDPIIRQLTAAYRGDFKLIPKEEEEKYKRYQAEEKHEKILPRYRPFPPVLGEWLKRKMITEGKIMDKKPMLKAVYATSLNNRYRIAEEGETPTHELNFKIPSEYLEGVKNI